MISSTDVTPEQLFRLHSQGAITANECACALGISYPTHVDRKPSAKSILAARKRCADLLNESIARAKETF